MKNAKTLVNFNISKTTLSAFDQLCRLSGKPRSIILNDLIIYYVLEAGLKIPLRVDAIAKIDDHLKSPSKMLLESQTNDPTEFYVSSLEGALKSIMTADNNPLFNGMGD
tara:strand:- start:44975 stop:45301 length:327 start_codon:yes stop_codon:yes gene_type:complete